MPAMENKTKFWGLAWWSNGQDTKLLVQGEWVQSWVRKLKIPHAMWAWPKKIFFNKIKILNVKC